MLYWIFRYELMSSCWKENPLMRPKFSKIASQLKSFLREVKVINMIVSERYPPLPVVSPLVIIHIWAYIRQMCPFSTTQSICSTSLSAHLFIHSSVHLFIHSSIHLTIHSSIQNPSIMFHLCPFLTSIHIQLLLTVLFNLLESQGLIRYSSNSLQRTYINITEDNNEVWWCFFYVKANASSYYINNKMPSTYSAISQIGNVETFITKLQKVLLTLVWLLR